MPTLTLNFTAQQYARGAAAIGKTLNLGRDATGEECKQYIISLLRAVVLAREREAAMKAAQNPPNFDPT